MVADGKAAPEFQRLRELARRASALSAPQFSLFLDPAQIRLAAEAARECGVTVAFQGGYLDAERRMAAFFEGDAPEDWPIGCFAMRWNAKYASPEHRDLLGALMGLGFERDRLGDIALTEGCAYAFATPEIAEWIARTLESAGRARLTCSLVEGVPNLPPPVGRTVRDTVPSLRLDAVVAAGFSLSRAEAQRLIQGGVVRLNHMEQIHTDAEVTEGDMISARGLGRMRLSEVEGMTRKGRMGIKIFRYGS